MPGQHAELYPQLNNSNNYQIIKIIPSYVIYRRTHIKSRNECTGLIFKSSVSGRAISQPILWKHEVLEFKAHNPHLEAGEEDIAGTHMVVKLVITGRQAQVPEASWLESLDNL